MELARAHKPDLILMDIQLPEVSGLEVTRWLKQDDELKIDPGHRRHRLRHEGRRGADPGGRLRGLPVEADFRREIHFDGEDLPGCGSRPLMARVLVVADRFDRAKHIETLLAGSSHEVAIATRMEDAHAAVRLGLCDIAVLDADGPGDDMFACCRSIRLGFVPVLMLTDGARPWQRLSPSTPERMNAWPCRSMAIACWRGCAAWRN